MDGMGTVYQISVLHQREQSIRERTMRLQTNLIMSLLATFVLCACQNSRVEQETVSVPEKAGTIVNVEQEKVSESVVSRPSTLEEIAKATGAHWINEYKGIYMNSRRRDRVGYNVESFDMQMLASLPESELSRIKNFSVRGTELIGWDEFDLSLLKNLEELDIDYTNVTHIRGLDETAVWRVSLGDVPLRGISTISGLKKAEEIWIRSTEAIDRLPDLSKLTEMYRLSIQANPLKSLDGIESLQRPVGLVLGMVNDISALEDVNPEDLAIVMFPEYQEEQPEIVEKIKEMGFEIYEDVD